MKKILFFFISILLSFCSINQTFALNYKNDFPSNFYTKSTVPDLNNPENYCIPWSGYDPKYLRLEYKFSGNYLDFDCYWDNGSEKLQSKGGWIMLKKEEPKTPPPPPKIPGCTNPQAFNYNPQATEDNGTCQEKIEGCTDSTALNYNPNANVHIESQCQYPPEGPSEITGFFENSSTIQIGATTWTLRLKTNVENAYLNIAQIQTWDQFKVTEYTTENKDIIITMRQFDDDRLNIEECTNYEVTIPKDAITAQIQNRTGTETIKNFSAITGNFLVKGCPEKSTNNDEQTGTGKIQEIQQKYKSTMNTDAFYVRLFDVDEDGNQHINLGNFIFLIGFAGFFISAMFLFLNFLKNSFIGKKSSR